MGVDDNEEDVDVLCGAPRLENFQFGRSRRRTKCEQTVARAKTFSLSVFQKHNHMQRKLPVGLKMSMAAGGLGRSAERPPPSASFSLLRRPVSINGGSGSGNETRVPRLAPVVAYLPLDLHPQTGVKRTGRTSTILAGAVHRRRSGSNLALVRLESGSASASEGVFWQRGGRRSWPNLVKAPDGEGAFDASTVNSLDQNDEERAASLGAPRRES